MATAATWLLDLWSRERDALAARVASRAGLPDAVCASILDRVFEHMGSTRPEPLRRAVRELVRAERERTTDGSGPAPGTSLPAFHSALADALRPWLEAEGPGRSIDAMLELSRTFEMGVGFFVEVTQLAARHASDRKAAELEHALAQLSAAQETLLHQARLKAMSALADGVAHDVNNALNAVLLRTTLLARHVDDRGTIHLTSIENVVRQAAATVQRLQEFAKRRERPSRAACEPAEVAREAIELTRGHWSERSRVEGRTLEVRLDAQHAPPVQADPSELRAILVDLVLNATEAIPGDGLIEISVRTCDEGVRIDVADDGPGIPPEHLQRIFEPFFTTRGPRSSGLGLAMAWGVVDRLGGAIHASNRPGGGAIFTVVLPRAGRDQTEWKGEDTSRTRSLLLVDDDDDSRDALEQILMLRGHTIEIAADGRQALALYDPAKHEAVLCDVTMPHMNGLQLARAIRAKNPGALIALLTGWSSDIADEERVVVDAVFRKPIDLDALTRFLARTSAAAAASGAEVTPPEATPKGHDLVGDVRLSDSPAVAPSRR